MKMKYRIVKVKFLTVEEFYLAQYRVKFFVWIPFWMSIGKHRNYFSTRNSNTHYDTYEEALNAVIKLKREMKRSSQWVSRTKRIVYTL